LNEGRTWKRLAASFKKNHDSPTDLPDLLEGDPAGEHSEFGDLPFLQRAVPAGGSVEVVAGKIRDCRAA
jgi:hypothetical protein